MPTFPKQLPHPVTAAWLIERIDERVSGVFGDQGATISSVAAFDDAAPGSLVFLSDVSVGAAQKLEGCAATVVIAGIGAHGRSKGCLLQVEDPTRWFVKALRLLFPNETKPGIHSTAVVSPAAHLADGVRVGANAVIEDDVVIGPRTHIGCGVLVAVGVTIGADCRIGANSVIGEHGLAMVGEVDGSLLPFPHIGRVVIGNRVEIGANCCVVRGILKDTTIGNGVKMANHVNIGHNCKIGDDCWISGSTIICGSAVLESRVMIAAGSVIYNHLTIGAGARIGLGSVVMRPVERNTSVLGVPASTVPFLRSF
jgi:UDP-3-O-[3-hydroxymyristoyl] glucosamine N-acyltransferase